MALAAGRHVEPRVVHRETGDLEGDPLREPPRPDGELPPVAGGCGVGLEPEVRLLRASGTRRKVEGLADDAPRLQLDPDDVIGGRPEAIGVGEIGEATEQRGGVPLPLRAPVDLNRAFRLFDRRATSVLEEREAQRAPERRLAVVEDVHSQAGESFVGDQHRDRCEDPPERIPGRLGQGEGVEQPPPGARAEVVRTEDQRPREGDWAQRHSPTTVDMI